jgi:hypothetical protein
MEVNSLLGLHNVRLQARARLLRVALQAVVRWHRLKSGREGFPYSSKSSSSRIAGKLKVFPWLGIAVLVACAGAQAQGIHKCVGKDGKIAYSNSPCPGSKEIAPAAKASKESASRPAATGASILPDMQAGKWKLRFAREGRVDDNEMCGDPISSMRREVQSYQANTKWGCSMTTSPSGPRSVSIVYDCPSDRAPDGHPVTKGRSELSLVSASPQSFRAEMKSTAYGSYVMEGARIGECGQ